MFCHHPWTNQRGSISDNANVVVWSILDELNVITLAVLIPFLYIYFRTRLTVHNGGNFIKYVNGSSTVEGHSVDIRQMILCMKTELWYFLLK